MEPGWQDSVDEREYRAWEAASYSGLSDLAVSPAYYRWHKDTPSEDTDDTIIGSAAHAAILQPDRFLKVWATLPDDAPTKPTKRQREAKKPSADTVAAIKWWDEFNANNADKVLLTRAQHASVLRLREAFERNPEAVDLLAACPRRERVALWVDARTGVFCKAMMDAMGDRSILDIKTVQDAGAAAFARLVAARTMHRQEAWYRWGASECGWAGDDFAFVALDKGDGPVSDACVVYRLAPEWMAHARGLNDFLLDAYARCVRANEWPGRKGTTLAYPAWLDKVGVEVAAPSDDERW